MSEWQGLLIWIVKFIVIGLCACMYRIGGMGFKWLRRFLMPIFYIGACSGIALWKGNWNWLMVLPLPFLIGAMSLGYGAEKPMQKLKLRAIAGIAVSVAFLPFLFLNMAWSLYTLHCVMAILGSILLGVFNQAGDAEECLVGMCYCVFPIMCI